MTSEALKSTITDIPRQSSGAHDAMPEWPREESFTEAEVQLEPDENLKSPFDEALTNRDEPTLAALAAAAEEARFAEELGPTAGVVQEAQQHVEPVRYPAYPDPDTRQVLEQPYPVAQHMPADSSVFVGMQTIPQATSERPVASYEQSREEANAQREIGTPQDFNVSKPPRTLRGFLDRLKDLYREGNYAKVPPVPKSMGAYAVVSVALIRTNRWGWDWDWSQPSNR